MQLSDRWLQLRFSEHANCFVPVGTFPRGKLGRLYLGRLGARATQSCYPGFQLIPNVDENISTELHHDNGTVFLHRCLGCRALA